MTRFVLVFVLALAVCLPTVRWRNLQDCGGSSRMATVESLVERGTFAIDGSSFAYSCDVMTVGGRLYSDKPPVLSVAGAAVYAVLHHGFGRRFDAESNPYRNQRPDPTYALMTLLLVTLVHALVVATFDLAAGRLDLRGGARILATLSAGFATPLWPLAGIFNSHTAAAAALLGGFYLVLVREQARPLCGGLLLGLTAAIDLPLGLLALALTVVASPERVRIAVGSVAPLVLHAALNWWIVGDITPFQMHRELYSAATGHVASSATGFSQSAGLALYAARNLVGSLGVFSLTPLVAVALVAAGGAAVLPGRLGRLAVVAILLFLAVLGLYVVVWPQAVGCAYGMRHVAPTLPPLLLAAAPALARKGTKGTRTNGTRRAFLVALVVSVVLAAGGLASPTTCSGFVEDRRAYIPALVFVDNVRAVVVPRVRTLLGAAAASPEPSPLQP